ncbi:MAG TPA: NUDIX hydrolase [Rhizomicrobium sp.]|nr:NUDIX hydrolase [Rhizomicrobium sp.]
MKSEALFREHGNQVAALCWRLGSRGLEVLLITSLNSRRWILPKGWPEADLTGSENAAREAFEEAGVIGRIAPQPVGHYYYLKEKRDNHGMPVRVDVFALAVTKELDDWPEKNARTLAWMPLREAIEKVSEPGVRTVLKNFHKPHATRKPAVAAQRHD